MPEPKPQPAALPTRAYLPIALLLLGYVVIVFATFQHYGITFDEPYHARYGDHILNWYRSGFADRDALNYWTLMWYGGLFDAPAQAATRILPFGIYETRHLLNALFAAIGVFAVWRIGVRLAGPRAGFLAALFLLFTPVWYGHSFANPKDIPFAALYALSLDAIVAAVPFFPRIPWKRTVWMGVTIGLALGVRFGGVLLFGCLGFAFLVWLFWQWRTTRKVPHLRNTVMPFTTRAVACLVVAWVAMLPWWPAAQVDPILHPLRTLRVLSQFDWNYRVFFDGQSVLATQLPWTYVPKWLLLTMPEFVLAGTIAAALFAIIAIMRRPGANAGAEAVSGGEPRVAASHTGVDPVRAIGWSTLLFAMLFPVLYAIATRMTLYDGIRHVLFVVPVLAVIAAAGFSRLLALPRIAGWAAAAVLAFSLAWTGVDMIRLHPYQYIWFNHALAGGLQKASASYETEYWGAAYKEAAEWVAEAYPSAPGGEPIQLATCSQPTSTAYFLPEDRFEIVRFRDEPDLFLGDRRFNCVDRFDGRVVHTIERLGVPLVTIMELSGSAAGEAR
jgi:hypothetical protein